jgi:hypothetical protein
LPEFLRLSEAAGCGAGRICRRWVATQRLPMFARHERRTRACEKWGDRRRVDPPRCLRVEHGSRQPSLQIARACAQTQGQHSGSPPSRVAAAAVSLASRQVCAVCSWKDKSRTRTRLIASSSVSLPTFAVMLSFRREQSGSKQPPGPIGKENINSQSTLYTVS